MRTLYFSHCVLHFTLFTLSFALDTFHIEFCTWHFSHWVLRFKLFTLSLHLTLFTLGFTLHTFYTGFCTLHLVLAAPPPPHPVDEWPYSGDMLHIITCIYYQHKYTIQKIKNTNTVEICCKFRFALHILQTLTLYCTLLRCFVLYHACGNDTTNHSWTAWREV